MIKNILIVIGVAISIGYLQSCTDSSNSSPQIINVEDSLKILILGNSITQQGAVPDIGWKDNWGMAASSQDKDFVHILYKYITGKVKNKTELRFENIALFERDYYKFDSIAFEENFHKHYEYNPHLIIIKIGDNVDENLVIKQHYKDKYKELILYFKRRHNPFIICTNPFFSSSSFFFDSPVEKCMKLACEETNTKYLDMGRLIKSEQNAARSERTFTDEGVGSHPGDKGMQTIADLLWNDIEKHLQ